MLSRVYWCTQLYFHLRVPYSEELVAVRNAQVLRSRGDISTNTSFNMQLKQFRDERAVKNARKEMRALFIPGQIVHLVDTSGDGNYVPYWAKRLVQFWFLPTLIKRLQ